MVVDPLAQGKGVGRALIDYGMQKADASDPSLPCWLEASAAGVPIYKRLGFRQVEWVEIDVDGPQGPQKAGMPAMVRPARLSGPDSIAIQEVTEENDLERCAEIFLSAFANDGISHRLFPARLKDPKMTWEDRVKRRAKGLKKRDFAKKGKRFMKAIDGKTGKILGVAIWQRPESVSEDGAQGKPEEKAGQKDEEDEKDPEMDEAFFKKFKDEMERLRKKALTGKRVWYVSYLFLSLSPSRPKTD